MTVKTEDEDTEDGECEDDCECSECDDDDDDERPAKRAHTVCVDLTSHEREHFELLLGIEAAYCDDEPPAARTRPSPCGSGSRPGPSSPPSPNHRRDRVLTNASIEVADRALVRACSSACQMCPV